MAGLRAAIVGTGYIARIHARAARELGGEVVAVCGRALSSAQSFGVGVPYDRLDSLLAEQKPDVVHICTPNWLHAEQASAAFAAGAHVICEKPLATSSDDARRMIDAAESANRVGVTMYNYRGYPLIESMRRLVRDGELGTIWRIGGCYLSEDVHAADRYVWHFSPGAVGPAFALMDLGVHWFDLAEYVTGRSICEVTAQFSTHQPKRIWHGGEGEGPRPAGATTANGGVEVDFALEDQADMLLRFDDGSAGSLTVSAVSVGHPNSIRLSLDGSRSGIDWHQQEPDFYIERSQDGSLTRQRGPDDRAHGDRLALPKGHPRGYLDAFRNVMAAGWQKITTGEGQPPDFAAGLRGLEIVEAAARSARERRTIALGAQ